MPNVTHKNVSDYLEVLADSHVDIKYKYRWNMSEFKLALPIAAEFPLMAYESPTQQLENSEAQPHMGMYIAFNILGKEGVNTSVITNKEAQEEVINHCTEIAKEFIRKIITDNKDENQPFFMMVETLSFTISKVGPVTTSSLYGARVEFKINPRFSTAIDTDKWN